MKFKRLETSEEVLDLVTWHNDHSDSLTIDCEGTSEKARDAKLVDIQLSGQDPDSVAIFKADYAKHLLILKSSILLVGHNYKWDAHVLFRHGIDLFSHTWRDTLLIGHLLDENRESHSLASYIKEYWNDGYKGIFWAKYKAYEEAPEEEKVAYACKDVYYTSQIYQRQLGDLDRHQIPGSLVEHVHRLQASLLKTEIEGIGVDLVYLQDLGVRIKQQIDELKPRMRGLVEPEIELLELEAWGKALDLRKTEKGKSRVPRPVFSFESTNQLQDLLYSKLGLPAQRNDKTKSISTDFASLEKIKESHPVVGLIQENRELQKVYTAYIEGTLDRIDQERIYPEFRVSGTVTGRISHNSPNLAQLPKSGGVRGIYVPNRGRVLVAADYSQLEVVIEANLTSDKNLIRMLENGESKHDLTARELGCDRNTAKTLNFALQYWASHYKVAKLLGISVDEGLGIWKKYWDIYRGPKELKAKTDKMINEGTPIITSFGRKRRFEIKKRQPWDPDFRQAYNFLIQSTGADFTSKAFYLVAEELQLDGTGRALFSVHDEILIDVNKEWGGYWDTRLPEIMCSVGEGLNLKIPLKAESSGPTERWLDK